MTICNALQVSFALLFFELLSRCLVLFMVQAKVESTTANCSNLSVAHDAQRRKCNAQQALCLQSGPPLRKYPSSSEKALCT